MKTGGVHCTNSKPAPSPPVAVRCGKTKSGKRSNVRKGNALGSMADCMVWPFFFFRLPPAAVLAMLQSNVVVVVVGTTLSHHDRF